MRAGCEASAGWPSQGRDGTARRMFSPIALPFPRMDLARRLDLEAGAELVLGHHAAAERLAHRAAELRGWSA